MDYKKLNNYIGWAIFIVATYTYVSTLEPTTSLWDCGEYITTAYKLEVGHPPGAPLFMMLGRLFTVFSSPETAAYMVNLMSGLSSAFTILFLYWSITMLAKKIMLGGDMSIFNEKSDATPKMTKDLNEGQKWAVIGSGVIGALVYTFSDSFWFSAVEGEVYAMSSFFTAIVIWAILKWDAEVTDLELNPDDETIQSKNPDRWLIFIFFMIGLSIGVHLLNLLCIPFIAYIIYFKKYKPTVQGFLLTGIIGVAVLGVIQSIIIPGTIGVAGSMERIFVNNLGLPFNTGAIFFFLLIIGLVIFLLFIARKKLNHILYTATWSFVMVLIGYSCFAMIVIRSNANPPLDENDPENLVSLEAYLKREQYGDWPIVYGQYFNSELETDRSKWKDRSDVYLKRWVVQKNNGKKDIAGFIKKEDADAYAKKIGATSVVQKYYKTFDGSHQKPTYKPEDCTIFPRMYSPEAHHIRGYISWSGAKANRLPTFGENLTFFTSYQIGWMYWRYFMWNFSGRQNDEQGHGNAMDGNWMTGLNFIDKHKIGDQTLAPPSIVNNAAHNKFFLLPLALGLIGFIFSLTRATKTWWLISLLFLLTGVAIIIYLNPKPFEPRERDYAYASSFYAFSFWIGLSVLGLYDAYKNMQWKDLAKIVGVLVGLTLVFMVGGTVAGLTMLTLTIFVAIAYALMITFRTTVKNEMQAAVLTTLICLPVPLLMAFQGWDDHDRSGRFTAKALAANYLNSCSDNSIVYTSGDNDTFPLWYLQEVEGHKTSVRVCNLSLLNTDWYTTQMKRRAYDSDPLPISFEEHEYRQNGNLDAVYTRTTNDMTMGAKNMDAESKFLINLKIKSNPEQFNNAFKVAANELYTLLKQSPLATSKPDLVESINGFDTRGNYQSFRNFVFDLLQKGKSFGLNDNQILAVQNIMGKFNDAFDYLPLDYLMDFLHDEENLFDNRGQKLFVLPTKGFVLKVDQQKIIDNANDGNPKNDIVDAKDLNRLVEELRWKSPKAVLYKADLMVLDMIAHNNWERNIYFGSAASDDTYLGLYPYLLNEGLVYKLVPLSTEVTSQMSKAEVNKDQMYHNLMTVFEWGNAEKEGILVDYYTKRSMLSNHRYHFSVLADAYADSYTKAKQKLDIIAQIEAQPQTANQPDSIPTPLGLFLRSNLNNDKNIAKNEMNVAKERVEKLIDKSIQVMPNKKIPYGRIFPAYIRALYDVESNEKADALANEVLNVYQQELNFYTSVEPEIFGNMIENAFDIYRAVFSVYQTVGMKGGNEELIKQASDVVFDNMVKIQTIRVPKESRKLYDQTFGGFFQSIQGMMGGAQ
jgi:hypothetical protein